MKGVGNHRVRKWFSDLFDLPPEVVEEVPRIELIGEDHLYIENHKGVLFFSQDRLQLQLIKGSLLVLGDHLKLKLINQNMISVTGKITELKYID